METAASAPSSSSPSQHPAPGAASPGKTAVTWDQWPRWHGERGAREGGAHARELRNEGYCEPISLGKDVERREENGEADSKM